MTQEVLAKTVWLSQVLDGTSVEAGEQASSRSQYAGRLTLDTLLERIAPARLESLRDLDLTGMALKDLADVLLKEEHNLSALQSLWLDQNELTEVCTCCQIPTLVWADAQCASHCHSEYAVFCTACECTNARTKGFVVKAANPCIGACYRWCASAGLLWDSL